MAKLQVRPKAKVSTSNTAAGSRAGLLETVAEETETGTVDDELGKDEDISLARYLQRGFDYTAAEVKF